MCYQIKVVRLRVEGGAYEKGGSREVGSSQFATSSLAGGSSVRTTVDWQSLQRKQH